MTIPGLKGVSENAKICVSADAKPQIPRVGSLRWACTFLFFFCRFHLRWVADANAVFSRIRALGTGAKYRGGTKRDGGHVKF